MIVLSAVWAWCATPRRSRGLDLSRDALLATEVVGRCGGASCDDLLGDTATGCRETHFRRQWSQLPRFIGVALRDRGAKASRLSPRCRCGSFAFFACACGGERRALTLCLGVGRVEELANYQRTFGAPLGRG